MEVDGPISIAGLPVGLQAPSSRELATLTAAFTSAAPADSPAALTFAISASTLRPPARTPDIELQGMRFWYDGDVCWTAVREDLVARVDPGGVVFDPADMGARGIHWLLLPALAVVVGSHDMCLLHAAAYLHPVTDAAVVILGGSGRGKSTVTAMALHSGRTVLSDDLLVLRRADTAAFEVCGVPQPVALPGDLVGVDGGGIPIPGDPRLRRTPEGLLTDTNSWHPIGGTVIVGHAESAKGDLGPAEPRQTFHYLLASTLDGIRPGFVQRAFPYAVAGSRCPSWRLGLSSDPQRRLPAGLAGLETVEAELAADQLQAGELIEKRLDVSP